VLHIQKTIRPWIIAVFLCAVYIIVVIIHNGGDSMALVTIGTQYSEGIPETQGGTEGYDGQFVYYIARDPSTATPYLDVPAYRFQRILLPALAHIASFGHQPLLPWVILAINLASLATGTALLEHLLHDHNTSRWYALTYGLTIGIFGSVRLSLSEPLAYALALGGILLAIQQKWVFSGFVFALAGLAKETTLLFPLAYVMYLIFQHRGRQALLVSLLSFVPFVFWQLVLYSHLGVFGFGSGGAKATAFEIIPFGGLIRIITEVPAESRLGVLLIFSVILVPFVIVPTIWAFKRCWEERSHWSTYTYMLFVNAVILPFVPFSTYREPLGILRFIIGLQIAVILYAAFKHNSRALRNATIWIVTILFAVSLI
jgi:hypothetical protein